MATLKFDLTIPLGDAGHITLAIDTDLGQLTDRQRGGIADTIREFSDFTAVTLTPAAIITSNETLTDAQVDELREQLQGKPAATVHDPSADVLRGVTGTRRNTS